MEIRDLHIENFKSIKSLNLPCKRVNVFIGEPNTGKSNILEVIGLLSHVAYGQIKAFVRFETMIDLYHDHSLENRIKIEFDDKSVGIDFKDGLFQGTFSVARTPVNNERFFTYGYDGGQINVRSLASIYTQTFLPFKFYRFAKREKFPNPWSESLWPPDGSNLLHVIMSHKELKRILKEIFGKFGYRIVFTPTEGKIEVQKEFEDIIVSVPYSLSSETLQRIVFYLTSIYSNRDSVISFEEPEAHAFPYYTKYLAERIAMDTNKNQYFIATHNPYLLLSLLEKTPKNEVAAFVTYLANFQTNVKALSQEETEDILGMGVDVFFNIEKFLSNRN